MKIAILNNLYYPFNRGGAESVIREMICDLKENSHEVFLITTKPRQESAPENNDLRCYYLDSDYYHLAEMPLINKLIWHAANLLRMKVPRQIKRILAEEKPDLVMTHNLMGLGFKTPLVIKRLGIRHEHYLHDIQLLHPSGLLIFGQEKILNNPAAKLYQFFTRRFFAGTDTIFSPSKWLLDQHRQSGFFKNKPANVKSLVKNKENLNIVSRDKKKNRFLFVGQIENHKGIMLLLKTFKKILAVKPDLQLFVVGDGRLLEKAQQKTKDVSQIFFLGRLDSHAVADQMAKSSCLIIPSLCYENSPMTIYEAHRYGLPIIAAHIGGIPEALNQADILFAPGNENDLAQKILSQVE